MSPSEGRAGVESSANGPKSSTGPVSEPHPVFQREFFNRISLLRPFASHVPSYCIHSRSFDHRRFPDPVRTDMTTAFF